MSALAEDAKLLPWLLRESVLGYLVLDQLLLNCLKAKRPLMLLAREMKGGGWCR